MGGERENRIEVKREKDRDSVASETGRVLQFVICLQRLKVQIQEFFKSWIPQFINVLFSIFIIS